MPRAILAACLACGLAACASSPAAPVVPTAASLPSPPASLAPSLRVAVAPPRPIALEPTSLGLSEAMIAITVTNEGNAPARVGDLHVAFEARRGDVAFACEDQPPARELSAGTLHPRDSFTGHAPLRCWTPLPGAYDARAIVSFAGDSRSITAPFRFDVVDPNHAAARADPARPGLYLLARGGPRTLPVGETEPDAHVYRLVLVFANASPRAIALPPARVTLDVYRLGDPLPCTTERALRAFAPIDAGAVHLERVPVTCLRDRLGQYEVRALVAFDGDPPVEAGRVRLRVTDDLGVIVPLP